MLESVTINIIIKPWALTAILLNYDGICTANKKNVEL